MRTFLLTVAILVLAGAAQADTVSTLDAATISGQTVEINADSVLVQEGKTVKPIQRADVADVVIGDSQDIMTHTASPVIFTSGGSKLAVKDVKVAPNDPKISFTNALTGEKTLDLSAVSRVYFPTANRSVSDIDRISTTLRIPDRAGDFLIVQRKAGDYMVLEGVLKEINKDTVVFNWRNENRRIVRTTVAQLRVGGGKPPAGAKVIGVARGVQEGSRVPFTAVSFKDGEFKFGTQDLGELSVRRTDLAAVQFFSDRVVELSSLKPTDVKEVPYFDKVFPHQVNRSAGGGPLKLGGETFLTGLGLHSQCQLTYQLNGGYNMLVALVGIDDSVRPAGNARLMVLGDGKELDKPIDLTGKDQPRTLRVKVAGVKQLIIRVDFGADKLDVGDQVDLVGARLVK